MSVCGFLYFDFEAFLFRFGVFIECIDLWMLFSCKKLVAAKKQMSILQAPNVLVIQLKVGYIVVFWLGLLCLD